MYLEIKENRKVMSIQFRNASSLKFKNIDDEEYREYIFPDSQIIRINRPLYLNVSKSGGHRLFDESGMCHYIPYKWIHLRWEAKRGEDHFRF